MRVTVIIPFRGDPTTLSWVLEGFTRQLLPTDIAVEVRVGGDGVTPPAMPADLAQIRFTPMTLPWSGVSEAKNLLLHNVKTDIVIFGNADTRPAPDFIAMHVRRLLSLPEGSLVLGSAPYEPAAHPTVWDCLKEETPMIFFYSQMKADEWYDFRHAWTLNLSVRHSDFLRAGGFAVPLRPYGHEDIEFAFRLMGAQKKGVYFDPAAVVQHRHPMTFADYMNREETLGMMAPVLHAVSPKAFRALFHTDDLDALAMEYRHWIAMDTSTHRWTMQRLHEWLDLPAATLGQGPDRQRLLMTLYQLHIPIKRLAFRIGFLHGLEIRGDEHWQSRRAAGLWNAPLGLV